MEHDDNSQELARLLASHLSHSMHGSPPHVIILHLNRVKLDVNRPATCCDGDPTAMQAYTTYHACVKAALSSACELHGFAHLFDVHGQSHREAVELGYLLTSSDLNRSDEEIDEEMMQGKKHSLQGLWSRQSCCKATLSEVVRGSSSLGALLENGGCPCTPSPSSPSPSGTYFWGAYTTRCYGQELNNPSITATQVEPPIKIRSDHESMDRFAQIFAVACAAFVDTHLRLRTSKVS